MEDKKPKRIPFEGFCGRIRKLPKFRDLPELEFQHRAKVLYNKKYGRVEEEEQITSVENEVGIWISKKEAEDALDLFNNYKNSYHLETLSDLELLKKLVYCEIYAKRIEKSLNTSSDKILTHEVRIFNELIVQILNIRTNLGLIKNKAEGIFEYIELLKKKAKLWREVNPSKPYIPCAWCGKPLYIKLKDPNLYEAIKHPLFKDRVLWNEELLELIKENKITVEEGANVLHTSSDNIKLMLEKKYGVPHDSSTDKSAVEIPSIDVSSSD